MESPAGDTSDESLASLAADGDEAAFEALVVRFQGRVFRLATRLTGNATDAADVLQETFLQTYRALKTFRGHSRFGTWIYRIATNAALMNRRTRSRRPAQSLEDFLPRFDDKGVHADTPEALRVFSCAEEILDRKALADRAREGIDRLPDLYREAFVLKDLEEIETAEVARILDIEAAAVRQRVHRARLMLRGYLQDFLRRPS